MLSHQWCSVAFGALRAASTNKFNRFPNIQFVKQFTQFPNAIRLIIFFFFSPLQGICPGNRLKIIQSHDSGCFTLSPASSPCPTIDSTTNLNSPIPSEIYENTSLSGSSIGSQRQGKRRSWHIMPNKVGRRLGRLWGYWSASKWTAVIPKKTDRDFVTIEQSAAVQDSFP